MDLTKEELSFLKHHGFSDADVFDGRPYRTKDWQKLASQNGKEVIIRSTPCKKAGHRLMNSDNHCVQCAPANFEFRARHTRNGYVYILGSLKTKMLKIGFSTDLNTRHDMIERLSYGGANDWEQLFYVKFENGGSVESNAQSELYNWSVTKGYFKDGKTQDAKELFNCSFSKALSTILKTKEKRLSIPWQSPRAKLYEF